MKIKKGFIIRKLGTEYMAVALGAAGKELSGFIRLNEAGSWLWNQLKEDISRDELIEKMCAYYEALDKETAGTDLDEFLESIKPALEV